MAERLSRHEAVERDHEAAPVTGTDARRTSRGEARLRDAFGARLIFGIFLSVFALIVIMGYSYSFGTESLYSETLHERVGSIDTLVTYDEHGQRECDGLGVTHVPFGQIFSTCGKKWLVTSWWDVITLEDDGGVARKISQAIRVENLEPVLLERRITNLPSGYYDVQAGSIYQLGDLLFVFILQKNMNTPLAGLPASVETEWGGVMVSGDDGAHWQSFLTYLNPVTEDGLVIRHNPVGMFVERGQLFVDTADAAGAGSGEGQLTRYVLSNDHESWMMEGCYYLMPEVYAKENGHSMLERSGDCLPLQLEGSY